MHILKSIFLAFSQTLLESTDETTDKKYTIMDLLRTPNIRKLTICSGILWYVTVQRAKVEKCLNSFETLSVLHKAV